MFCFVFALNSIAVAQRSAVAVFPSGAEFGLEIAADDDSRRRGYMHREEVGPHEGMLFVFDSQEPHTFWMKNCRVSLDIIWLNEMFHVVDIAHDQPPCPEQGQCPSIRPLRASRYVLEVAGGTAQRHGLRRGDRLVILSDPKLP